MVLRMFVFINVLSSLRAPLALFFLQESVALRTTALLLAMITDMLDGYLARLYKATSKFGAILDPVMDKFFVFFVSGVFLASGEMLWWQMVMLVFRDICLFTLGIYMWWRGRARWECRSVMWGKICTFVQFGVLMALCLKFVVPWYVFISFVVLGLLTLHETCEYFSVFSNESCTSDSRKAG